VARLAVRVGQRLEMDAQDLVELDLAARLHDVGKIRVAGDILRKPGPLSAEERHVIELHPLWGTELAGRIPGLQAVAAIIGFHHERPDGGGYPHGLAGERIPLASRLVAACDAYGAMTEHRPYRAALSPERALAELGSAAGRQFHPEVVAALRHEVIARPLTPHNEPPARSVPTSEPPSEPEREVLGLVARGASAAHAAAALGVSRKTIRVLIRSAIARLDAHTSAHAVALALDSGQISLQADPPRLEPEAQAEHG
jgi:HD-GYP domain-containing protein (c-di-GMP phosphodiesterase class II)/DNA-binding CsgD family transcriptional regulator